MPIFGRLGSAGLYTQSQLPDIHTGEDESTAVAIFIYEVFVVLVNLMLLNLLIVIMNDATAEVRGKALLFATAKKTQVRDLSKQLCNARFYQLAIRLSFARVAAPTGNRRTLGAGAQ